MADIEDAPRLRELCERAAKEYDNAKLVELIRQINDLLDKKRQPGRDDGKTSLAGFKLCGSVDLLHPTISPTRYFADRGRSDALDVARTPIAGAESIASGGWRLTSWFFHKKIRAHQGKQQKS